MRILLIEDDIGYLNCLVPEMLRDYVVDIAHSGYDGAYLSEVNDYDAIIMDASLKDCDTNELCKKARSQNSSSSLMVLSEKYDFNNVLSSMDAGADLCIPKNTKAKDICKGVNTLLRKKKQIVEDTLIVDTVCINLKNKKVSVKDKEIILRRKEYDILEYLLINKNRVVSKEDLLDHLWTSGIYIFSNTVEVHVKHLRDKIEKPYKIKLIKTVRGFGYRINDAI